MTEDSRIEKRYGAKDALLAIQRLQSQLAAAEQRHREPIAIIGMSCRFPGGATNPARFWQLLIDGGDAITEVPPDRWDATDFFSPDVNSPGKMNTRWGGFLDGIREFDPDFFNISPREALYMDPQQRLFMEVAWEALEDAGCTKDHLRESNTGVYVGVHSHSLDYFLFQSANPELISAYTGTGTAHNVIAGRLSYWLDLRGPSLAIDTACSSSLVALHVACQALRAGDCDRAIVGGVNLVLSPEVSISISKLGAMSGDGRCKAFDVTADGYVRGEGCGVVVLRRLSDALACEENILAIIAGSAVRQDGYSNGLTAPSGLAQREVIKQALAAAQIEPADISYLEAHGTGTVLGDSVEYDALLAVFGAMMNGSRIYLGSVKSNVGHLEGAAGICGLIKVVLALAKKNIPPSLHFSRLNPELDRLGGGFVIPTRPVPWQSNGRARQAGISSFGWSGTNAHVIVREPYPAETFQPKVRPNGILGETNLLTLSGHTTRSLRNYARNLLESYLRPGSEPDGDFQSSTPFYDICYTLGARRTHHVHRLAIIVKASQEAGRAIQQFLNGAATWEVMYGKSDPDRPRETVFVYPGQGGQALGMCRRISELSRPFREALAQVDEVLRDFIDWSVRDELAADETDSRLQRIEVVQVVLFAVQVALTLLWRSLGVVPDAVVGQSMGEVAAAWAAGALSLEDAAKVICARSQLLTKIRGRGGMAVVGLTSDMARRELALYEGRVVVAGNNSPSMTVVSGPEPDLAELMRRLDGRNVFCRRLNSEVPGHSPQIDELCPILVERIQGIQPAATSVLIYSTVTADIIEGQQLGPQYWARNLRSPVLFSQTLDSILDDNKNLFLELSPNPSLVSAINERIETRSIDGVAMASLCRDANDEITITNSLASLYVNGAKIDWERLYSSRGRLLSLPTYPFDRKTYFLAEGPPPFERPRTNRQAADPWLGCRVPQLVPMQSTDVWETTLGDLHLAPKRTVRNSETDGQALRRSTCVMMAYAAAFEKGFQSLPVITNLRIDQSITATSPDRSALQLHLSAMTSGRQHFELFLKEPDATQASIDWRLYAAGDLEFQAEAGHKAATSISTTQLYARCTNKLICQEDNPLLMYVKNPDAWVGTDEAICRLHIHSGLLGGRARSGLNMAPMEWAFFLLDVLLDHYRANTPHGAQETLSLNQLDRIQIFHQLEEDVLVYVRLLDANEGYVAIFSGDGGKLHIELSGLRFKPAAVPAGPQAAAGSWRACLDSALPSERKHLLSGFVQQTVTQVLGMSLSDPPDPARGLFSMGMDSIMATRLRSQLESELNLRLPATLVFEHPDICSVVDYLWRELAYPSPAARLSGEASEEQYAGNLELIASLEKCSEEDAETLLARLLDSAPGGNGHE